GKIWKSDSDVRVGKLASLEIVLEDGSISRNHAELKAEPGGWTVRDLSSTNGTFVNGVRLGIDEYPLQYRDIVQFGTVTMIVELSEGSAPPAAVQGQLQFEESSRRFWGDVINES